RVAAQARAGRLCVDKAVHRSQLSVRVDVGHDTGGGEAAVQRAIEQELVISLQIDRVRRHAKDDDALPGSGRVAGLLTIDLARVHPRRDLDGAGVADRAVEADAVHQHAPPGETDG